MEIWGKHFTQQDLSDRSTLSLNTLSRIFKRDRGVDRLSLEYLFRAFGLELTAADLTSPTALGKESQSLRANPQQDRLNIYAQPVRKRSISLIGGAPNIREYSRLNCEGLS